MLINIPDNSYTIILISLATRYSLPFWYEIPTQHSGILNRLITRFKVTSPISIFLPNEFAIWLESIRVKSFGLYKSWISRKCWHFSLYSISSSFPRSWAVKRWPFRSIKQVLQLNTIKSIWSRLFNFKLLLQV